VKSKKKLYVADLTDQKWRILILFSLNNILAVDMHYQKQRKIAIHTKTKLTQEKKTNIKIFKKKGK